MADMFQGIAPPSIDTTKTQATSAPTWYSDYLSNLASAGQQAVQQGGVAGFSPLQQQAYSQAPTVAGVASPYLQQASNLVSSGTATAPSVMNQYMNPYTQQVADEIGRLGIRGLQENILPSLTGSAVGTGQYGSKRSLDMQRQAIRDTMTDIAGRQGALLQSGYQQQQQAAQADLARQLQGAQLAGTLGTVASQTGLAGLNALSTLGAQQQAQEQAQLNYPMTAQTNLSQLLRGFTVPTSVTETYKGPMPNLQYAPSQFAQIAGLGSLAQGLTSGGQNSMLSQVLGGLGKTSDWLKTIFGDIGVSNPVGGSSGDVSLGDAFPGYEP